MDDYYTYAYLREDKTPYYIGKGRGDRAYRKNHRSCSTPTEPSRILILKKNLSEFDAYKHEIYMIAVFGRKDLDTGILRNLSDGGEGSASYGFKGKSHTPQACRKMSKAQRGSNHPMYGKTHTETTKVKMSKTRIGKPWSQARRDAYNKSKEE
jgi:hypothetical protein